MEKKESEDPRRPCDRMSCRSRPCYACCHRQCWASLHRQRDWRLLGVVRAAAVHQRSDVCGIHPRTEEDHKSRAETAPMMHVLHNVHRWRLSWARPRCHRLQLRASPQQPTCMTLRESFSQVLRWSAWAIRYDGESFECLSLHRALPSPSS
jgi:hypothetical protein